jgi:hypothetical protein
MIKTGIIYLILSSFIGLSFAKTGSRIHQDKVCISIQNNSGHKLVKLSIFSIKFKDLPSGRKTSFKSLNFNKKKDDAMLYLTAANIPFMLYIPPKQKRGNYTYTIDSLDLQKRYIYLVEIQN